MANNIEYTNNSVQVTAALKNAVKKWLYEAGGELQARIIRNSRTRTGQTKGSYQYHVDEENGVCTVGSALENAVWEEFGTGEYAVNNDGRKNGWWIKVGNGRGEIPLSVVNKYKWVKYRYENGGTSHGKKLRQTQNRGKLAYVFTYGKKPNKPMQRAFEALKEPLERRLESILKDIFEG